MKSSPSQQNAVAEGWTADFLVLGQTLYHWAILWSKLRDFLPSHLIDIFAFQPEDAHYYMLVSPHKLCSYCVHTYKIIIETYLNVVNIILKGGTSEPEKECTANTPSNKSILLDYKPSSSQSGYVLLLIVKTSTLLILLSDFFLLYFICILFYTTYLLVFCELFHVLW